MRIHSVHKLISQKKQLSTRPFRARGAKVDRCIYCQIEKQHCICRYQPDVETHVAVLLLYSENEVLKPSNTGRLIADTVKETYSFQWSRTEPDKKMLDILNDEAYAPYVVFPDEYVEDKQRITELPVSEKAGIKPLIILLDGSWREARRMFRKSPYLNRFPVISMTPESISEYLMRKSDNEQHLSTAEVACLVLKQFSEYKASKTLELWFDLSRDSYMLSKTRERKESVQPALERYLEYVKL